MPKMQNLKEDMSSQVAGAMGYLQPISIKGDMLGSMIYLQPTSTDQDVIGDLKHRSSAILILEGSCAGGNLRKGWSRGKVMFSWWLR
jgi:hypothetical protein